mmetsp:Transcript_15987/g.30698  ORF Transcript_15987/g.30698 Transcript_15987/m.30698 type:complete len:211 (-) Transcript_15987:1278-1910(-)
MAIGRLGQAGSLVAEGAFHDARHKRHALAALHQLRDEVDHALLGNVRSVHLVDLAQEEDERAPVLELHVVLLEIQQRLAHLGESHGGCPVRALLLLLAHVARLHRLLRLVQLEQRLPLHELVQEKGKEERRQRKLPVDEEHHSEADHRACQRGAPVEVLPRRAEAGGGVKRQDEAGTVDDAVTRQEPHGNEGRHVVQLSEHQHAEREKAT